MSRERNRHAHFESAVLPDRSLVARLAAQLAFAAAELRADPVTFIRSVWAADAFDRRNTRILWSVRLGLPLASGTGFALGVMLYAMLVGVTPAAADTPDLDGRRPVPRITPLVALPANAAGARRSRGGGGGGDHDPLRVSQGVPPPSSLADPVAGATTHDVERLPDPLPVPPPIKAPPVPPFSSERYGDPLSGLLDPSDGPGSGGGAGTGRRGGWGPGTDRGDGMGDDGGRGGPSNTPRGTGRRAPAELAARAVILNAPRPSYTEAARQHKTQGAVQLRVLLGADGRARRATVLRGLPNGLDEMAIEAVGRLEFRPARDHSGRPVDSWVTISVAFTIR